MQGPYPRPRPHRERHSPLPPDREKGASALALLALAAAIYGGRLGIGYLADDFLYLGWWQEGWGELLRRVTVDSNPRMIRPLPAVFWSLSALPGGAVLHHVLSLFLHAVCGWLVARLVTRSGGSPEAGLWTAALFVAFPLLTEPVLWLSAAPDLWACALALAALDVGLGERRGAAWAAAGLFALSLLSKESTLMLPAIAAAIVPWRRARHLVLTLAAVAALYLACRLTLFAGIGGYLDAAGHATALEVDAVRFLRNLTLQLPYRVVMPLKRAGDLAPLLALVTACLATAAAGWTKPWRRPGTVLRGLAALALAALPVAAFLSLDVDHENARLFYFPIAVLAAAGGAVFGRRPGSGLRIVLGIWLALWSAVTIANGRPWSEGGLEVRRTLAAMRELEPRYPAGATVLVDGHDTWRGAYVWRNGLAFAARRAGLRDDVHWLLGSAALVAEEELLGRTLFGLGLDADGRPHDLTACQRQLLSAPLTILGRAVPRATGPGRLETGPIPLERGARALAVVIAGNARRAALEGRVFWRRPERVPFDVAGFGTPRFNVTEARRFKIFPGSGRSVVRLPTASRPVNALEVRIELTEPEPDTRPSEIRIAEVPELCR